MATLHPEKTKGLSTKMAGVGSSVALEGLPKTFVSAMKTLFEVMDDSKTGFVKLTGTF